MPATKVTMNELDLQPFKVLRQRCDNGTGTRTNYTAASWVDVVGTGDTSYTAPANINVTIAFTMQQMCIVTSGIIRCGLKINSTVQDESTYHTLTSWGVQTICYKVDVNAGQTITFKAVVNQQGGGTGTLTNANTDYSYPNSIVGVVVPRL